MAADLANAAPDGVLPAGVTYRQLDVRSDADWAAACEAIERDWGGLDLLVNNAGIAAGGRIEVAEMSEWEATVAVNLLGVVRGCRTFTRCSSGSSPARSSTSPRSPGSPKPPR